MFLSSFHGQRESDNTHWKFLLTTSSFVSRQPFPFPTTFWFLLQTMLSLPPITPIQVLTNHESLLVNDINQLWSKKTFYIAATTSTQSGLPPEPHIQSSSYSSFRSTYTELLTLAYISNFVFRHPSVKPTKPCSLLNLSLPFKSCRPSSNIFPTTTSTHRDQQSILYHCDTIITVSFTARPARSVAHLLPLSQHLHKITDLTSHQHICFPALFRKVQQTQFSLQSIPPIKVIQNIYHSLRFTWFQRFAHKKI